MSGRRLLIAIAVVLVAGCARDGTTPLAEIDTASPTPRPRPLPPVAESSAAVNPDSQSGQQVFITDEGFRPRLLFAIVGEEISFINETLGPATVRFSVLDFSTGPIEPGERATYTPPGAYSIVYHLAGRDDVKARIQVGRYFDPGEDPAAEDRLDADTPGESRRDQIWR